MYLEFIYNVGQVRAKMNATRSSSISKDGHSSHSGRKQDSDTRASTQPRVDIPIWFSVFIGNPDSTDPRFQHARFDAKVSEDMFRVQRIGDVSRSGSIDSTGIGSAQDMRKLCAIISLSISFTDEILNCFERKCIVCKIRPAESLVYRPLCAIETGYNELADFRETYKLISTIASHADGITRMDEMNWSIGSFLGDRPYICALAIPICSDQGECHRVATQRTQQYIEDIIDGVIPPRSLQGAKVDGSTQDRKSETLNSSITSSDSVMIKRSDPSEIYLPDLSIPDSPLEERLYNIGTTMFVGRPILQFNDPLPQGELSCFVLSMTFPYSAMPNISKNQADAAIDYCRVSGYYEQELLHHVDLQCAVCPKSTSANTLVHVPITFPRTQKHCLEDGPARKLIIKLCQFVNGTWNYPEMNAALGLGSDAHIFELAVPICETKAFCEEVARISAREFLRLLAPSGLSLPFPGLTPDTNLAAVHAVFRSFSEKEPLPAETLVEKIAPGCLVSEAGENKDDAQESTLSVGNLRAWFEKCYRDPDAKSELSAQVEKKKTEQKKVDNEGCENEDSVVWVFDLVDHSNPSNVNGEDVETERPDPLIEEYRHLEMFRPLLNMSFWLLYETIGSRDTDGTDFSDDQNEQYSGQTSYEGDYETESQEFSSD